MPALLKQIVQLYMVLGHQEDSPELSLGSIIHLIDGNLTAEAFSDDPIAKMHNSR
jgi:hypothetical protein